LAPLELSVRFDRVSIPGDGTTAQLPRRQNQPHKSRLLELAIPAYAKIALRRWTASSVPLSVQKSAQKARRLPGPNVVSAEQRRREGRDGCSFLLPCAALRNDVSAGHRYGRRSPYCRFYRPIPVAARKREASGLGRATAASWRDGRKTKQGDHAPRPPGSRRANADYVIAEQD
jgi:hypothetical protein